MKRKKIIGIILILLTIYVFYLVIRVNNNSNSQKHKDNQYSPVVLDNQRIKNTPVQLIDTFTSEDLIEMMEKGVQGDLTDEEFDSVLVEAWTGMDYHSFLKLSEEDKAKIANAMR